MATKEQSKKPGTLTMLSGLMSLTISLFMLLAPLCADSWAAGYASQATEEIGVLRVVAGKSILLKSAEPVKRVSLAKPEIADFVLISPQELYIMGKAPGVTTLMLWHDKRLIAVYDVEVAYDISQLKEKLNQLLPGEKDLRVLATNDSLTLSGKVSNTSNLSQALALARAFAPKGQVNNLAEVGGVHQVMLEVRVAEMQRSVTKQLGFNITGIKGGDQFGV